MKKSILSGFTMLVLFGVSVKPVYAQDPAFSQPYSNPVYLNPAYAGTSTDQRIGFNYRNQWPNIPGNFVTYNAYYDRNFIDSNNGIAFLGNIDQAGNTITTDNFSLIYSHQFHINSFTLSAGVQGTYLYKCINESQLNFGNTSQPVRGFVYTTTEELTRTSISIPDFSAGILGYGKNYFVGFSADHFTQPDESFVQGSSQLPLKYTANAGIMIHAGCITFTPAILYEKQGDFNYQVIEGYLTACHLTLGVGARFYEDIVYSENMSGNAWNGMIFSLGYQCKYLRIGYSYDYYVSNLTTMSGGGAYEASLTFLIPYQSPKLKKVNGLNIPAF